MLTVGDKFPEFRKQAVLANKEFSEISSDEYKNEGKWMVMFWYPKRFYLCLPHRNHRIQ